MTNLVCTLHCLQGVFIFFFHVVFNKDARKNLKNVLTGKKNIPDDSSTTRASLLTVSQLLPASEEFDHYATSRPSFTPFTHSKTPQILQTIYNKLFENLLPPIPLKMPLRL